MEPVLRTKTMSRQTEKISRDGERGATVVEFSVIASLLLLVVFGILEFAFIFYQRHYIANAAREGLRVGVRADNFNCFDGFPAKGCTANLDRKNVVRLKIIDYLDSLYQPADIPSIGVVPATGKSLKVTVTVNNFFPPLLTGFIPGFTNPATLTYSTTGRYEDPDEYDLEHP
jgi:hypothetical protein